MCIPRESRRARRIRHTRRVATRRHYDYIHRLLNGDPTGHRWAETSAHFWAKTGIGSCSCVKRRHGAPRRSAGPCDCWARERIYRLRAEARVLNILIRKGADLDGDEVALLSSGRAVNNLW